MKFNPYKLAFSAALVMSTIYGAWTVALKYFPKESLKATGKFFHIKGLIYLRPYLKIDLKTTILGAVYMFLFIYAYVLLTVLVYRILYGKSKQRQE